MSELPMDMTTGDERRTSVPVDQVVNRPERRLNEVPVQSSTPASSHAMAAGAADERTARLCAEFLRQWPVGVREGGPTAQARAVMDDIATLADPADALWAMAGYAIALDAKIQAVLRARGRVAYSRISRECDRQSGLGFGDHVVDACCAFVESVRTNSSDGLHQSLADVDRLGYRAFSCLTSMTAHLAEVLIEHGSEFRDYDEVVSWLQHRADRAATA